MTRLRKPTRKLKLDRARTKNNDNGERIIRARIFMSIAFGSCLLLLVHQYQYVQNYFDFDSIVTEAYGLAHELENSSPLSQGLTAGSAVMTEGASRSLLGANAGESVPTGTKKSTGDGSEFDPPLCTAQQLGILRAQLKPDHCERSHMYPFLGRCSFSWASSCPDTPWLDKHLSQPRSSEEGPFTSFFVGCNKAIDAVYALRLGSRNQKYDVDNWKRVLAKGGEFAPSSCDQFKKDYSIPNESNQKRSAQVFCFEPVTATFAELSRTKEELGWGDELVLEEAALSSFPGSMSIPTDLSLGHEQSSIKEMRCKRGGNCKEIPIYTLNDYVSKLPQKPQIQYLSIDVEGYDFEVLKGASDILKDHVHYLEFEYNWKGPWENSFLGDAIQMLYDLGFICYWPGPRGGQIWRITGCWQDHYKRRFWSNVACVNGQISEARSLAEDMEQSFLNTLEIPYISY